MKKNSKEFNLRTTVCFFLTQVSQALSDALGTGYQIPPADVFRGGGVQRGGCIPWQRSLSYHLVKVSGKFCLKIISLEWCRIWAVIFLFCGRRFRGTCCSLLMLLDKLMTVSLRWVWNLNQNLVSDLISEWAWNKFRSSCTHLATKLSWEMSKMNCKYFHLLSLLIYPNLEGYHL